MITVDKIQMYIQQLPEPLQAEVFDFVEYLLAKVDRESAQQEEIDWSSMSISSAMRGMEDEYAPVYNTADLKVVFS